MIVHIACIDDGHIVPRMSRWLQDAHGWSMAEHIDPQADVNLYMPYTMIGPFGLAPTKTAAWMTHFEPDSAKARLWRRAERSLSLRLATAPIYLDRLTQHGPTARITPGIDRDHFTPDRRRKSNVIGVSGVGSERKGTHLAGRLQADGYEVVAAGKGWGIDGETHVAYEDMPGFYRSIGVFLCTSLIEGIPAPPLEALATGVKVVVPAGVGMMDELPEMPGIRHYEAGNYDDMRRAVDEALADEREPDTLRDVTEPYSIDAWCESVVLALEELCD